MAHDAMVASIVEQEYRVTSQTLDGRYKNLGTETDGRNLGRPMSKSGQLVVDDEELYTYTRSHEEISATR